MQYIVESGVSASVTFNKNKFWKLHNICNCLFTVNTPHSNINYTPPTKNETYEKRYGFKTNSPEIIFAFHTYKWLSEAAGVCEYYPKTFHIKSTSY